VGTALTLPRPAGVSLREVTEADLATLFAQQLDPEATAMVVFPDPAVPMTTIRHPGAGAYLRRAVPTVSLPRFPQ
jgi:hypothetical protein